MKPSNGDYLAFGPFRFDPTSGLLFEERVEVALPPRASALLTSLLEAPGEMVSKEELIEAVWGETAVSDQSLTEAVKLLRRALHDDPKNPVYIHTLRGRGYRFIATVSTAPKNGPTPTEGPTPMEAQQLERGAAPEHRAPRSPADISPVRGRRVRRWARRFALATAALMVVTIGGAFLVWTWLAQNTDRLARLEQTVGTVVGPGGGMRFNRVWADGAELSGSVSPDSSYIAYVGSGDTPQLWLYLTETGREIQLTRYERPLAVHRDGRAVFSRDGREIAYVVVDRDEWVYEMHVLTLGGTHGLADSLATADARTNGDSATSSDDSDALDRDATAADADDRVIYRGNEFVVAHDWTVNGRSVFAALKTAAAVEIVSISAESGLELAPPSVIKTLAGDEDPYSNGPRKISLSPDGRTIAYDVAQNGGHGNRDVHTLSLAGGTPAAIVEHPLNDHSPLWAPDGQRLIFVSNREGEYDLWTVPIASGPRAELAASLGLGRRWNVRLLGLTTNGSLYYGSGFEFLGKDIWIAPLEAGTFKKAEQPLKVLPAVPGQNLFATWSPDGKLLAHVAERGRLFDHDAVVVINSANGSPGSKLREVFPLLRQIRQMRWSPNGGSILAKAIHPAGFAGIHLIDPGSNDAETVVGGVGNPANINYPRWSPDGEAFFYWRRIREPASDEENGEDAVWVQRILRHDLSSPEATADREIYKVVEPTQIKWLDISPDGERVGVYTEAPSENTYRLSLRTMPASGGTPGQEVWSGLWSGSEGDWSIHEFVWTPDPEVILFVRSTGGNLSVDRELWKLDLVSSTTEPIGIFMPGLQTIALDPAGKRIAFAASTQAPSADVWVLSNFLGGPAAANGGR